MIRSLLLCLRMRSACLLGETTWIRRTIREFDAKAKESGVRIINCCGFDSIPSDLGTFLVADHIKKTYSR